jgi:hypothetical protein
MTTMSALKVSGVCALISVSRLGVYSRRFHVCQHVYSSVVLDLLFILGLATIISLIVGFIQLIRGEKSNSEQISN